MKYPEKLIIPYFFRVWKRLMEDVKLFLRHWDKIRPSSIFSRSGQSYLKHHTFFFFFFFFLNYPFSMSEKGLSHTIPLSLFFFFKIRLLKLCMNHGQDRMLGWANNSTAHLWEGKLGGGKLQFSRFYNTPQNRGLERENPSPRNDLYSFLLIWLHHLTSVPFHPLTDSCAWLTF